MRNQLNRSITGEKIYREIRIRAEDINRDDRTISLSFGSEEPVEQWFGTEKLIINLQTVDLSRILKGLCPLLLNHNIDQTIGVVESATIDGTRIKALVRFSKSALGEEIYNDVIDRIRQGVSFGYAIDEYAEITDELGHTTIEVRHLTVLEVTIASIPADITVGVNRSHVQGENVMPKLNEIVQEVSPPVESSPDVGRSHEVNIRVETAPVPQMDEAERERIAQEVRTSTRKEEIKRLNEIDELCNGRMTSTIPNIRELARDAKDKGHSVDSFRAKVLSEIEKRAKETSTTSTVRSEYTESDSKQFSIARAISAHMAGDWTDAKLERDMMRHCAAKSGRAGDTIYVPYEVFVQKRTLSTTSAQGAIQTIVRPDLFINPFYASSVTSQLGATVLNGLYGSIQIPRLATSFGIAEHKEAEALTESDGTFNAITLTPKGYGASAVYSKQLFVQQGGNVDEIITNDILKQIPLKIDKVAIAKILADANAGVSEDTTAGFDVILDLEKRVLNANVNPAKLAFATSPALAAILKRTPLSGTYPQFVMQDGKIFSYNTLVSSQMAESLDTAGKLIFGDWSELYVGFFGNGIDLTVDNITLANFLQVRITASVLADIGIRHSSAFAYNKVLALQ